MGVRLGNIDLQYQLLVIKYSHCDILIFYQKIMVGFIYNFLQILFLLRIVTDAKGINAL